jgi:hypothetical protein
MKSQSYLLEHLGVPKAWFSEALAMRSAYNGSAMNCLNHTVAYNVPAAVRMIEDKILPLFFLFSVDQVNAFQPLLLDFSEYSELARAVCMLLALDQKIPELSRCSAEEIRNMERGCEELELIFKSYRPTQPRSSPYQLYSMNDLPSAPEVPGRMMQEALEHLKRLKTSLSSGIRYQTGILNT